MADADDEMCRPTQPDGRNSFVFEDEKDAGTAVFFAVKSFGIRQDGIQRPCRQQVTAVTGHERGTEKKSASFVSFTSRLPPLLMRSGRE